MSPPPTQEQSVPFLSLSFKVSGKIEAGGCSKKTACSHSTGRECSYFHCVILPLCGLFAKEHLGGGGGGKGTEQTPLKCCYQLRLWNQHHPSPHFFKSARCKPETLPKPLLSRTPSAHAEKPFFKNPPARFKAETGKAAFQNISTHTTGTWQELIKWIADSLQPFIQLHLDRDNYLAKFWQIFWNKNSGSIGMAPPVAVFFYQRKVGISHFSNLPVRSLNIVTSKLCLRVKLCSDSSSNKAEGRHDFHVQMWHPWK